MRSHRGWLSLVALLVIAASAWAQDAKPAAGGLPAFPGAEGYGAASAGGRGGRVVKVTNLNASGPGSFMHACEQEKGPRIIVFQVSGVIPGPKNRKYNEVRLNEGRVTIAGQTAPGGGVTFEGLLRIGGSADAHISDVVVRFLRIRANSYYRGGNMDFLGVNYADRAIVDHVSVAWAPDECVDLINSNDVTLQWCTIEESDIQWEGGDEPHNFALIVGYTGGRYSIHHNLFAHHHDRAPAFTALKRECDVVNNVLYNFATGCSTPFGNLVGNYCKSGPGAYFGFPRIYHPPATLTLPGAYPYKTGRVYMRGNFQDWSDGYFDAPPGSRPLAQAPIPTAPIATQTAQEAYGSVLAKAGCFPRDAVTQRTVYEVCTRTGEWGRPPRNRAP